MKRMKSLKKFKFRSPSRPKMSLCVRENEDVNDRDLESEYLFLK